MMVRRAFFFDDFLSDIMILTSFFQATIYVGTPFVLAVCRLYPRWARYFTFVGLVLSSLALIICSCCDNVSQLIAAQGFLFGAGGCISNGPCVLYINEWFVRRKGLAYGIVWSACGFGGVIIPLALDALLSRCGFRTTMRIYAGIVFVSSVPLAFWVKPRLRYPVHARVRLFNTRYIMFKLLVLHQLANAIQATGFFLPSIYLPTYAQTLFHASASLSSLTLILINISTMISSIVMGFLVDKLNVMTCIFISAVGTTASVLLVWGLSENLSVIYVFCVLYGIFAGCWTSTWPGIMREISQRSEDAGFGYVDPMMVYGHLCIGRGIGNIISGPLSDALIRSLPWQGQTIGGYGSGYGVLIVYVGLTSLISGMNFVWRRLGLL